MTDAHEPADDRPDATAGARCGRERTRVPEPPTALRDGGDVELLALIDRLAALLDRSDLAELEVEVGRDRARPAQAGRPSRVPAGVAAAPATHRRRGRRRPSRASRRRPAATPRPSPGRRSRRR